MVSRIESRKKWFDANRAKGNCLWCTQPAMEGHRLCEKHMAHNNAKSLKDREKAIEKGLCTTCKKRQAVNGKRACYFCLEKNKENTRTIRNKKLLDGICIRANCNNKHKDGAKLCEQHMDEWVKRNKLTRILRQTEGYCRDCGNHNIIENQLLCETCQFKVISSSNLGTSKRWKELKMLFESKPYCPYTGHKLTIGVNASLNHIIPKWRGGSDSLANLEWVYCDEDRLVDINRMLGHMLSEEFKDAIKLIHNHITK